MLKHLFLKGGWVFLLTLLLAVATGGWAVDEWLAARHLRENGVGAVATVAAKRIEERRVDTRRTTRTVLDHIVTYDIEVPRHPGGVGSIRREHTETRDRYVSLRVGGQVKVLINPDDLEEIDFGTGETAGRARMASWITLGITALSGLGLWSVWGPAKRAARLDRAGQEAVADIVSESVSSGYAKLVVAYRTADGTRVESEPPPVRARKLAKVRAGNQVRIEYDPDDPGNVRVVTKQGAPSTPEGGL